MSRHIALLRGINVGGRGLLSMADLRALAASVGFTDVKTLLQSGNMVFSAPGTPSELERKLEAALKAQTGRDILVMVRTPAEWAAIIDANPMPDFAQTHPSYFQAFFMKAPLDPGALKAALASHEGPESFHLDGRTIYASFPGGMSQSTLMDKPLDKRIGAVTTARNWNTVLKLRDAVTA
ncbi:DUF1697 domain-containing protein [Caulobacter segnis]|uniref:DUF1697 domain-containing protein n=1 Tax=Caulobacter segnis TaxID=88688 RepID=UPI0024105DCD|nr:DUF1697 domain-containing protein [Caulobacter segnis]MDG2523574.1 DUF1697 domain-containing protein [Caulobacter segnis]